MGEIEANDQSSMAILASLRTLRKIRESRTFLTVASSSPIQYPNSTPLSSSLSRPFLSHRSPLSKWVAPLQGPLFLGSPPWKLSQSATPLHCNGAVLRKVEALNLLRGAPGFPIKIGFAPATAEKPRLIDREDCEGGSGRVGFSGSFVNLPNAISMSRLASGPLLGWMIANEMYSYAFVGLAITGATDWLDGYVARKMRINSVVGSYLDPLADKVLIGCVALGMVHKGLLHPGLVGIVVLRDALLVGGAVYLRAKSLDWKSKSWYDFFNLDGTNPKKVKPLFISKVNTVFQLVLVAAALLQPEFGTVETQTYISYLSWLVASTTVASTAAYGAQHMKNRTMSITRNP